MARKQPDRVKERHWRQHLAAWRRSGWTIRAYCQAEGLSEPSFYAWRRVLAERRQHRTTGSEGNRDGTATAKPASATRSGARPGMRGTAAAAAVSAFVPVRLVEAPASAPAVEVVLRGGRVVRVAAGFAAKTLREVVAVLEGWPC